MPACAPRCLSELARFRHTPSADGGSTQAQARPAAQSDTPIFEMFTAALGAGSCFSDRLIQLVNRGISVSNKVIRPAANGGAESLACSNETRSAGPKMRQAGFKRPRRTAVKAGTLHHTRVPERPAHKTSVNPITFACRNRTDDLFHYEGKVIYRTPDPTGRPPPAA